MGSKGPYSPAGLDLACACHNTYTPAPNSTQRVPNGQQSLCDLGVTRLRQTRRALPLAGPQFLCAVRWSQRCSDHACRRFGYLSAPPGTIRRASGNGGLPLLATGKSSRSGSALRNGCSGAWPICFAWGCSSVLVVSAPPATNYSEGRSPGPHLFHRNQD